jgi:hypothetical protein
MLAESLFPFSRRRPVGGPRSFSAAAWLQVAALTSIGLCLAPAAHGQETEEERGQRLMRTPPQALAQSYLDNEYTLTLLDWAKHGATVHLTSDGEIMVTVTQANVDTVIAEHEYRREVYERTIRARGYGDLAGNYHMTVARACDWYGDHRQPLLMKIRQDEFRLNLAADGILEEDGHSGVTVNGAIVFALGDPDVYLMGRLRGDRIELSSSVNSKCTIVLALVDGARARGRTPRE